MNPTKSENISFPIDARPGVDAAWHRALHLQLSAADRRFLKRILTGWNNLTDILKNVAGPRQPIGELLVAVRRISTRQLDEALLEQRTCGEKLGAVLIRKGWITASEIETLLKLQQRLGNIQGRGAGPLQLGNLLVRAGEIAPKQLQQAVAKQRLSGGRIGEILVDSGYASETQIARGLRLQNAILALAIASALAISLTSKESKAMSTVGDESNGKMQAKANVDFALKIPAFLRVKFFAQPEAITIQEDDVKRGYIDIPSNTQLQVLTNIRDGFLVHVRARFDVIQKVLVTGGSNNLEINAEAGSAMLRQSSRAADSKLALGYRFFLTPGLRPGNYPWPVTVSAASHY
jgi:hypothetical protein